MQESTVCIGATGTRVNATGWNGLSRATVREALVALPRGSDRVACNYAFVSGVTGARVHEPSQWTDDGGGGGGGLRSSTGRGVFAGPINYHAQPHLVVEKEQCRARGPRDPFTDQPPKGRTALGGIRLGPQERDALLAWSVPAFTRDRLLKSADFHRSVRCAGCGHALPWKYSSDVIGVACAVCGDARALSVEMPYCATLINNYFHVLGYMAIPRVRGPDGTISTYGGVAGLDRSRGGRAAVAREAAKRPRAGILATRLGRSATATLTLDDEEECEDEDAAGSEDGGPDDVYVPVTGADDAAIMDGASDSSADAGDEDDDGDGEGEDDEDSDSEDEGDDAEPLIGYASGDSLGYGED
jgi:ribosomal protein S27E